MFLKDDGTVVLNEVNTLPGMTSYSRYPRMMAAAGLPLAEVIDRMVSLALTGDSSDERRLRLRRRARARDPLGRQVRDLGQLHRQAGRRIPGQPHRRHEALCAALESARDEAAALGFGLLLWDGYRPQRAVDCFLRWAQQPEDGRTKPRHYPNIDRAEMFEQGYVAARSGHSRGSTVDLTLFTWPPASSLAWAVDHDLMDPISHHGAGDHAASRRSNRRQLVLAHGGLRLLAYDCEWWHYTLEDEPFPDTYFDFPVR